MNRIEFIVDTDAYSGNFERQLAGYLTGQHNETHGDEEAEVAQQEMSEEDFTWFEENTLCTRGESDDEYDHPEYGNISITPGWVNNGSGKHARKEDQPTWKYPSHQSVAITFDEVPPEHIINLLKERAHKYADHRFENRPDYMLHEPKLTILGFRMKRFTVIEEELPF